ncbi:MAG: primosomal protein N' [Planctomycetota bacterium]|nr:MAG: primosomal protein N' [Planctomycetota bacterium]
MPDRPPGQPSLFAPPAGREATAPAAIFARVALDLPLRREFSYAVAPGEPRPQPGCRVRVPFGSRRRVGVVVGLDPHPPDGVAPARIRPVERLLDREPLLTPALLRLARQIADDTFCSWGQALAAMLPAALRRDRPRRTVTVVELVAEPGAEERRALADRFPKQEKALAWLRQAGGPVEVRDFCGRTGLSRSPLESLARKGWVRFGRRRQFFDPFRDAPAPDVPPRLTPRQEACVAELCAALDARRHADFLLHGITGSGKTEVYLRALERCLEQGRGAIVLVPEIALTPQTVARFRARAGRVAVLHSGLTDAERHDQWLALRHGRLRVVVGARSALFAPVPDLGLIVVDEEHETSFKQDSTPRYHAREVALARAELEGAVCVLGSATPSLEAWAEARAGRIRLLELPERVAGGSLPRVHVVDMRQEKADRAHWLVVSEPLRRSLEQALARGERGILFLNRRGFSPAWHCRACGGSVHCPSCDVSLTYHRWRRKAVCHSCLQEQPAPTACPKCAGPLHLVGVGTERAEDTLRRLFPQARIARMDRDTMVRREDYEQVLGDFAAGRYDLLLGTQMVAKGLDFPEVTVVGVLDADTSLHQGDFRDAERCFDLICQVSGRAGRSHRGGEVVVQTWLPDHPAIRAAARHDFAGFAAAELRERAAFLYPPAGVAVRVRLEDPDPARAEAAAVRAAEELKAAAGDSLLLLGPNADRIEKLRGRYRQQILLKARSAADLRPCLPLLYDLCQRPGVTVERL